MAPGITVLDFIRYNQRLTGTKIGCREGDCGACTVLVGSYADNKLNYQSATSCLMPLGNAAGKHIVTVEGLNTPGLNPVQQAMIDQGATQCGFCTPGFVMSLAGFCLQDKSANIISAIDGNICRCTGYKSIERAANSISEMMKKRNSEDVIGYAIQEKIVPEYFSGIRERLALLKSESAESKKSADTKISIPVGGGTDLYVQKHEVMVGAQAEYLFDNPALKGIRQVGDTCIIGSSSTVTDLLESKLMRNIFPHLNKHIKLISSTPIRNMATLGGNLVNASPIGDLTIFFLALDSTITLSGNAGKRDVSLKDFYKGYKSLDKKADEVLEKISFPIPGDHTFFNFEKVSKRTNLDIASVNSAMKITVIDNTISEAIISAGGVGPVPMVLTKASAFLIDKVLNETNVLQACLIADEEITPISDARGADLYKRLLLKQLIKAHFITLFDTIIPQNLMAVNE